LYVVRNYKILPASLLNICGFATFMFDLVFGQGIPATTPAPIPLANAWSYA